MLQIKGNQINRSDKTMLRRFCQYTLDLYVQRNVQNEATIILKFIDPEDVKDPKEREEFEECRAWTTYNGKRHGKRHFLIEVCNSQVSQAHDQLKRLREAMKCVGHELIHVKQYLNNEMFDYVTGEVRFRGKVFEKETCTEMGEKYYFSPFEVEAYGHETGLYMCFKKMIEDERKQV